MFPEAPLGLDAEAASSALEVLDSLTVDDDDVVEPDTPQPTAQSPSLSPPSPVPLARDALFEAAPASVSVSASPLPPAVEPYSLAARPGAVKPHRKRLRRASETGAHTPLPAARLKRSLEEGDCEFESVFHQRLIMAAIGSVALFRLSDLTWGPLIGEGYFGRVFKCSVRFNKRFVVVKVLKDRYAVLVDVCLTPPQ